MNKRSQKKETIHIILITKIIPTDSIIALIRVNIQYLNIILLFTIFSFLK